MKKILSCLLYIVIIFSICACNGNQPVNDGKTDGTTIDASTTDKTTVDTVNYTNQ